ncbi:MAG: hypothetical protein LBR49_02955 [Tannerella sp.]|jgi:magnesium-transporting ATPase (P-type)|nr:hypothetical protein [Tannerella sp.]
MAVTKIRKISSWTLWAVLALSVGALALFYFGGVVDPNAEKKEPINTNILLYWVYIATLITVIALLIFGVFQFITSLKTKPKAALGSLVVLVLFAVLLGITYTIGNPAPLPNINVDSAHFNVPFWLKVSDMWIYTIYILLALCVIAMIASSVKKILNK